MLAIQPAQGHFIRRLPELEKEIGEKPAQLLLQIEYWIRISTTAEINGKRWTYQSTPDIQEKAFPSWSQSTINRVIQKLHKLELIHIEKFNKARFDKTRWFSLNAVGIARLRTILLLDDLCASQNDLRSTQNDARSNQNDLRSTQNDGTIPETPSEISALTPALIPAAAPREDAAAAEDAYSPVPEKAVDEKPMPAATTDKAVVGDDLRGTHSQPDSPNPPVPPNPLSPVDEDCPEEPPADLKAFFNGCRNGELELMIAKYGETRIRAVIDEVRLLPNIDNPPGMVKTKLKVGAQAAWKWPKSAGANYAEKSGADYLEGDYARFISGPYASIIKH